MRAVPAELLGKKRKNITTNVFGETLGRIHMPRQDLKAVRRAPFARPCSHSLFLLQLGLNIHKRVKKSTFGASGSATDVADEHH